MAQTLKAFSAQWERDVVALWKPSARKSARSHLKIHLRPALGELELQAIRLPQIQALVARLAAGGSSRHTITNVLQTLRSMLTTAEEWGEIAEAPRMARLRLPEREEEQRGRWYTPEQVQAILEASPEPWRTLWMVAAMTGMRSGEILGLTWPEVDLPARVIRVRKSWVAGEWGTVKSRASRRDIPMPEVLAEALLNHQLRQTEPNPLGLVFPNQEGRPLNATDVLRRKLQPLLKRLGIPRAGLHAYRHAQASALVASGADPKIAQAQLGHSDVRTTLALYAHRIPSEHRDAVERVAEQFTKKDPRRVV